MDKHKISLFFQYLYECLQSILFSCQFNFLLYTINNWYNYEIYLNIKYKGMTEIRHSFKSTELLHFIGDDRD